MDQSPLDQLPNELIYELCETMNTDELFEFARGYKRALRVCDKILKQRLLSKYGVAGQLSTVNPFASLSEKETYEICSQLDNLSLSRLAQSNKDLWEICQNVLDKRRN